MVLRLVRAADGALSVTESGNVNEEIFDRRLRKKPGMDYYRDRSLKPGRRDGQVLRQLRAFGVEGRRCLDIGPGSGRWLQYLKENDAAGLAAVDISREALDRLEPLGVLCQKADVEHEPLEFEADAFDIVLAFMVLEHLKDPSLFIDEVLRVVRPSGLVLMTIPNIASFQSRIRLLFGMPPVAVSQDPTHVSFYTIRTLRDLFESHGADIEVIPTGFSLNPFDLASLQVPTNRFLTGLDDNRLFRVRGAS